MEIQILPLIIVVAYLVGMLTVGAVVSKVQIKNAKDYMVAGRRMGLFMVAFSLSANNIGGGCTTGLAQKAFGDWGLSAVWYVLAASIAMIPLAYFAPKIRKTMAVTIPEVVGRRFGKFSSNFTAILSVLSLFCLTSSQIAASGGVINALIPSIPLNVCLIFAGIVIILYTTMGGMIADQISDLLQFGIILVGLAIATPIVLNHAGGWNAISAAAPHTDFIIYNIPQLAGVALSVPLLHEMRKNPRVIGVKNSSMPTQDIQIFKAEGGENFVVFNGPDEQFVAGRAIGADGGIGGTYAVMPELFLAMDRLIREGRLEEARKIQYAANDIIAQLCACHGNLYAVMKKVLEKREGLLLGSVRAPLSPISVADLPQIEKCAAMIDDAVRAIGA